MPQAARVGDTDLDSHGDTGVILTGSPTVIIGDGPFPSFMVKEPGVILIGGMTVYDQTPAGQAASVRDEIATGMAQSAVTSSDAPVSGENPTYVDCGNFPEVITMNDMSKPVSKWFKLGNCKELPVAQRGLKANQIACNWRALCQAVLDPVYEQFKFSFNSGFRNAARDSGGDHGIGCAADISCGANTIAMFKWMVANQSTLNFSQIIYEKHNSAWVHVSFNGKGPKGSARTMWTYTGSAPYGKGGQTGSDLPPTLHA
jgi:hypothetical protein